MVNATQQRSGVDRTHTVDGLFAYGKLVKKLHFDALKVELLFRGCTEDEVDKMKINERKTKLKEMEIKRLEDDNEADGNTKAAAQKAFKPLSAAVFPAS
jgi:hypothetical protein